MKTKNFNRTTFAVWAAALALTVSLTSPTATRAANITWGSAQNITGDSNVNTTGVLVEAVHYGDNGSLGGSGPLTNATVNGVNFQAGAIQGSDTPTSVTVGNFTLASSPSSAGLLTLANGATGFGSANTPFTNLSAGYQAILGSAISINTPDSMVLTMNGLAVGQTYQFEWFVNYSGPDSENHVGVAGASGNAVTLNDNTTGLDGGVGQYDIGTFVADSTQQVVTFEAPNGGLSAQVNAVELRAVPDSMNTLMGLGLAVAAVIGFSAFERQRRTLQKV